MINNDLDFWLNQLDDALIEIMNSELYPDTFSTEEIRELNDKKNRAMENIKRIKGK